jgi:hypothetical protein
MREGSVQGSEHAVHGPLGGCGCSARLEARRESAAAKGSSTSRHALPRRLSAGARRCSASRPACKLRLESSASSAWRGCRAAASDVPASSGAAAASASSAAAALDACSAGWPSGAASPTTTARASASTGSAARATSCSCIAPRNSQRLRWNVADDAAALGVPRARALPAGDAVAGGAIAATSASKRAAALFRQSLLAPTPASTSGS